MKSYLISENDTVNMYANRCDLRQLELLKATMNFVEYFINLGDDKDTANAKVAEVSTEVAAYLYAYVLGNRGPLINGITNSTLVFMDQAAKDYLTAQLAQ